MREEMALSGLRKADEAAYLKTIGLLLLRTMELLNATNSLTTAQIADLTVRISKQYYYFRLDELVYVLDRGAQGEYGRDYNRVDAGLIMGWLEQYDTTERLWAVEEARQQAYVETPTEPLSDELLGKLYQRVRAGEKTEIVHVAPRFSEQEKQQQDEARLRYIAEKRAGIVEDYRKQSTETETQS